MQQALQSYNETIERASSTRYLPVNIAKFLKISIVKNIFFL